MEESNSGTNAVDIGMNRTGRLIQDLVNGLITTCMNTGILLSTLKYFHSINPSQVSAMQRQNLLCALEPLKTLMDSTIDRLKECGEESGGTA